MALVMPVMTAESLDAAVLEGRVRADYPLSYETESGLFVAGSNGESDLENSLEAETKRMNVKKLGILRMAAALTAFAYAGCGGDSGGSRCSPTSPECGRNTSPPSLSLQSLGLDFDEDSKYETNLTGIVNNGNLTRVRIVDGTDIIKEAILDGNKLIITPIEDANGKYRLEFTASNENKTVSGNKRGLVRPKTDFGPGQLQSNETDTGRPGQVRIYSPTQELIEELETDTSGNFPRIQLSHEFNEYIVQAMLQERGQQNSYVRTRKLKPPTPGSDIGSGLTIRTVPYDGLAEVNATPEEFYNFMRVNFAPQPSGLKKWLFEDNTPNGMQPNPPNFLIIPKNPITTNGIPRGELTQEEAEYIKNRILNYTSCVIEGRQPNIQIGNDPSKYTISQGSEKAVGVNGWVTITADTVMNNRGTGVASKSDENRHVFKEGAVRFNNNRRHYDILNSGWLIDHEVGGLLVLGNDNVEDWLIDQSVLPDGTQLWYPGTVSPGNIIDCRKTAGLVNESQYLPGENIDDILRGRFYQ